jgi:hypothetical protein
MLERTPTMLTRTTLAAALLLGATLAAAPAAEAAPTEVPPHKCEPKPKLPGPTMRQDKMVVRRFQRDVDQYRDCMKAYADERQAASKAHTDAGNAAIGEYNATMKAIQEEQGAK